MNPVYITKYALTKGIIKATPRGTHPNGRIIVRLTGNRWDTGCSLSEYALTEEEARIQAEAIRSKRIASLKKQIEKLEKLEIKIVEQ